MKKIQKMLGVLIIFLFLLAIGIGIVLFKTTFNGQNDTATSFNEGDVTKYQWLEMFCEQAGIAEYIEQEPYFEDVLPEDDNYQYVQAAVEWELLSTKKNHFSGEDIASGRFIALTAMKGIGKYKLAMFLESDKELSDTDYINLAIEHGFIKKDDLQRGFSEEECEELLEKWKNLFYNEFWVDDYSKVDYKSNVTEIDTSDIQMYDSEREVIDMKDTFKNKLGTGDIIVFSEGRFKIARKIISVDDRSYELEPVEVEDVIEKLVLSDITQITFDDIVSYYGEENLTLTKAVDETQFMNVTHFDKSISHGGYSVEAQLETDEKGEKEFTVTLTNNNNNVSFEVPQNIPAKTFSDCEDFDIELTIGEIVCGTQIDWNKNLNYFDFSVDSEIEYTQKLITKNFEKKIPLFDGKLPIADGLADITLNVYAVVSIDGEISIKVEIPFGATLVYEHNKGARVMNNASSPKLTTLEVDCEITAKYEFQWIFNILKECHIIDIELNMGVVGEANIILRDNSMICTDVSCAYPVIDIDLGGDDDLNTFVSDKMHYTDHWDLITADEAPKKVSLHHEILPNGTKQIVDECTYDPEEEEALKNNLGMYITRRKSIDMVSCPTFSFNISDDWSIKDETLDMDRECDILTNDRGVTITFCQDDKGFVAEYYGGAREMLYAEVTKMAESAFSPGFPEGTDMDCSSLGKFVVAKIKVYAFEDGESGEGEQSYDGPTFYAVVPESYLGEMMFSGAGYWTTCSFDYPNPVAVIANSPDGSFTYEEEKEVIEILSSFTEVKDF